MPLVQFELRNEYGLGDPKLYLSASGAEDPKPLLDGIAVAGLVGVLRQLGDLAEFAADVFHDLHEQITATATRGKKMMKRIQHMEAVLPSIEKAIQGQKNHLQFAYVAGSDWHTEIRTDESQLLSSELPRFLMDSYEECRGPPRLYMLDKFDTAGSGACLKRYSDPSYFKRVWTASEPEKSVNGSGKKKPPKCKKKAPRLDNVEEQLIPIAQPGSSNMGVASTTDAQSISSENISTSDARLKSELGSASTSFDLKTGMNTIDQVLDTNPSESSNACLNHAQSIYDMACSRMSQGGMFGNGAKSTDGYSQEDTLQVSTISRCPLVVCNETSLIMKSTSTKSCEGMLVDTVQDSQALAVECEALQANVENTCNEAEGKDMLYDIGNLQVPVHAANHLDEVPSETVNYMDALTTMESEAETDLEYQTKVEVKSVHSRTIQELEMGKGRAEVIVNHFGSSIVKFPIESNLSLNMDAITKFSDVTYSEGSDFMNSNDCAPIPDYSDTTYTSENNRQSIPKASCIEDLNFNMTSGSSTLGVENSSYMSELVDLQVNSSAMFWTNGGILGVEPSKPADIIAPNTSKKPISSYSSLSAEGKMFPGCGGIPNNSCVVDKTNGLPSIYNLMEQISLRSSQLTGDMKCLSSGHVIENDSIGINQNNEEPIHTLQVNEPERLQSIASNGVHPPTHASTLRDAKDLTWDANLCHNRSAESHCRQSMQTLPTLSTSSVLSGLTQRFLVNVLQDSSLLTNDATNVPTDTAYQRSQEISYRSKNGRIPKGIMYKASSLGRDSAKQRESFKSLNSPNLHHSGQSSPPLEHMKISFHPLNGSEISKLKLNFSNGNSSETSEDISLPSFQLLPGPIVQLKEYCYESDNDTFCKSCSYSSEDLLSPRSESDWEHYEETEKGTVGHNETYGHSRRISSLSASVSDFVGQDGINHQGTDPSSYYGNAEIHGSVTCLPSGPVADIPDPDFVQYMENEPEKKCDPLIVYPTALQPTNDLPPPPPPLPPIQWMMMKSASCTRELTFSSIAGTVERSDCSHQSCSTVSQQEKHNAKNETQITRAVSFPNREVNGEPKQKGVKTKSNVVNGNDQVNRENLLQEIRSKSFSLRRTVTEKSTYTPPRTVVKILEKAKAIRQVSVSSDEEGDGNWSDV